MIFYDSNEHENVRQNRRNAEECCETPSLKFLTKLIHFCSLYDYFECMHCSSILFRETIYLAN